jgi:ATP:ADP antiporter, AAA family
MSPTRAEALDRQAAAAAALAAFLLISNQVASRAVRDALFLSAFDVTTLPLAMGAAALAALAGAEMLSLALTRRSPAQVVPLAATVSAVLLGAWYALGLVWPAAAAVLVYLHVSAFGGALISGFWSLVNERFDPHTARKVVGRIGTGATAGGMAGGALAWVASQVLPLGAAVLLLVVLGLLAAATLRRTHSAAATSATLPMESQAPAPIAAAILLRNPHLRNVALLVFLGAITEALVDFQFKVQATERFVSGSRLLGAFAAFHTAMGILSLGLQAMLSRATLRQLGIAGTLALRPLLTAASSLAASFMPRFETATLARGAHESLTNSLFRSAYELLYTPVPEAEKRRVKTVVDVSIDKAGALVGSAAVALVLTVMPARAESLIFALAVLLSLLALGLSRPLHRGYVQTLEQSLLAGRVRLEDVDAIDYTTQVTLAHTGHLERDELLRQIAALRGEDKPSSSAPSAPSHGAISGEPTLDALLGLRSGDPRVVRAVLRAHPEPTPELVAGMLPLLAQDVLVPDLVRSLRRVAPRVTGQLVDALLDPSLERVVRRRVPRILKACATARAAEGLQAALDDPAFDVRAAAAAALAAIHERSAVVRTTRDEVLQRVRRELDSGETVERQIPQIYALLSLALERGPLQIAWAAMKGDDRSLRGTALEYLANVLPEDVFKRLRSLFGAFTWTAEPVPRPVSELANELRTSALGLQIEGPPWRESGETGETS